uniref:GPI mannosyltransferase 2 n=1 Tax=Syphacia muris TaxID=451379 RepID=A0A158R3U3_9BILA
MIIKGICICIFSFIVITGLVAVHGFVQKEKFCTAAFGLNIPREILKTANENHLILPGDVDNIEWCRFSKYFLNPLPVFYGPIQKKYWDVGFLQYWQLRKIPCFILSLPAFPETKICKFGDGFRSPKVVAEDILCDRHTMFPFMIHASFISLCGAFFYNVEVVTRMLFSSSPFVYFVIAELIESNKPDHIKEGRDEKSQSAFLPLLSINFRDSKATTVSRIITFYIALYAFIGSAMHAIWLPFV